MKDIVVKSIKKETGIDADKNAKGGTSDGRFIAKMNTEIIELGLLNNTIHQINECVSVKDIETLKAIYLEVLRELN